MPAPNRTEILRRAKDAYPEHGRGCVVGGIDFMSQSDLAGFNRPT